MNDTFVKAFEAELEKLANPFMISAAKKILTGRTAKNAAIGAGALTTGIGISKSIRKARTGNWNKPKDQKN